jgi:hypothetical protein
VQPTLLTRLRWRLEELRDAQDARVVVGILVLAVLVLGGFLVARTVARASTTASPSPTREITVRQRVRVVRHGHIVTRWRTRTVKAQVLTVRQTRTLDSASGVVTRPGQTRTVLRPVRKTSTATRFATVTSPVTVTRLVTVEQPVTVVDTTTVVTTVTETVPVTVTVTVPVPTTP